MPADFREPGLSAKRQGTAAGLTMYAVLGARRYSHVAQVVYYPVGGKPAAADQFFTEAQFEAYRSLGEHVGDRLFLRTFVGDDLSKSTSVLLKAWFTELAKRTLEPTDA